MSIVKMRKVSFAISFVIFFFVAIPAMSFLCMSEKKSRVQALEDLKCSEQNAIDTEQMYFNQTLDIIVSDVYYLKKFFLDKNGNCGNQKLAEKWCFFCDRRGWYDQIQYIDKSGKEDLSIVYSNKGSKVSVQKDLKNFSKEPFFVETSKLPDHSLFISSIHLDVVQSSFTEECKPMAVFAAPLYKDSNFLGIIVLHYYASLVLDGFRHVGATLPGQIQLVSSNGYWIEKPDYEESWCLDIDFKKDSFANTYQKEWTRIKEGESTFIDESGMFSSQKIAIRNNHLFGIASDNSLIIKSEAKEYIISVIARDGEFKDLFNDSIFSLIFYSLKEYMGIFILIFAASLLLSLYLTKRNNSLLTAQYQSKYDGMTGTYNRRAGKKYLMEYANNHGKKNEFSICFIDINSLKVVNDTLGHSAGDELIITASNVIRSVLRTTDLISRFGGDEFVVVFSGAKKGADIAWERILEKLKKINEDTERPYIVSLSHGIVVYNSDYSLETQVKMADELMYAEKQQLKKHFNVLKKNK